MGIRTYVCLILLSSSQLLAEVDLVNAKSTNAFTKSEYTYVDTKSSILVNNMPPIKTQDSLGTCYGCSAATLAQKYMCDNDSKNYNCNDLNRERQISQLSMVAWAETNLSGQKPGDPNSHTNIKIGSGVTNNGFGANALLNSMHLFSFMPESCYPFDQLVNKYGTNTELVKQMIARVEKIYQSNKKNSIEADVPCTTCLEELNKGLNASFSPTALSSALSKSTFGEFLYSLIFADCKPIKSRKKPNVGTFPEIGQTAKKEETLGKIKEVLRERPVQIENVCIQSTKDGSKCAVLHSLVVSGYREVCSDSSMKFCKPQVRIHNCWGEDWQKSFNDGWVDAEPFIKNIMYGQSNIQEATLSWLY